VPGLKVTCAKRPGLSLLGGLVYCPAMRLVSRFRALGVSMWAAAAYGLAAAGILLLYFAGLKTVTLVVDGRTTQIRTHARTVAAALRDGGWPAQASDRVSPDPDRPIGPGARIHLDRAQPVVLQTDGETRRIWSPDRVPANILAAAGARLLPGAWVWADGVRVADPAEALPAVPTRLRLDSPEHVSLDMDGASTQIASAAPTLAQKVADAGIQLFGGDRFAPGPAAQSASRPALERSTDLVIAADGRELHTRATADTVRQALSASGLIPVGLDFTIPALDQPLPEDGRIRLVRVLEEVVVEQIPLEFETVYQPVTDLEIDNQRLIESGAYGVTASRIRVRLEDGQEVGREVEGSWVAVEPRPRLVGYGTQIVVRTLATDDGTIEYWRAIPMYATSYTASTAGTPVDAPWYGITASGRRLTKGLVAIDRRYIPFGTRMYVPGYGFADAADTGSAIRGRRIDLGYDEDNFVGWHHTVTVYFLTPVPSAESISWIFP